MTLYLDAVWLLNLLIDFMILRLTGYLNKKKNSGWRIFGGSLFASMIVFVTVLYPSSLLLYPLGKIIFSFIIIVITFKLKSWIDLLKTWLYFYFVSFAIGGILLGVHFIFQQSIQVESGSVMTVTTGYGTPISWGFVVIGFPLCWYFTKQTLDKQALVNFQADQLFVCEIQIFKQKITTTGYLDSANHLNDPITDKPVVIIDRSIIKQIVPADQFMQLEQVSQSLDISQLDPLLVQTVSLIPYQDLSNPIGVLIALKPDLFTLTHHDQIIKTKNILIGLRFSDLTSEQEYHCLLNPQLFKYRQSA